MPKSYNGCPGASTSNDKSHSNDEAPPARPLAGLKTTSAVFVALMARGLWPVGIYPRGIPRGKGVTEGKEPFGPKWGLVRWTIDKFKALLGIHPGAGCGLCLGPGRGPDGKWLIDVEGDGPEAEESRARLFGGELVETLGWGSVRGGHQILTADGERLGAIVARLKPFQVKQQNQPGVFHIPTLPGLELRIGGVKDDGTVKQLQSVVPPTPGTDGKPRAWNGVETIADVPESFYANLEAAVAEVTRPAAGSEGAESADPPKTDRPAIWLRRALENGCGRIAAAPAGERHPALLAETRTLAGYLHYGIGYTETELEARAIAAADRAAPERKGDNPRCVRDAIDDGKAAPLTLPDELHAIATGGAPAGRNGKATAKTPGPEPSANGQATKAEAEAAAERPAIELTTRRDLVLAQAVAALDADPDLYCRARALVGVVAERGDSARLTRKSRLNGVLGSPTVVQLSESILGCRLTGVASFYTVGTDKHGEPVAKDAHPPDWLIRAVQTRRSWPGVRPLLGVAGCPFPRPDGTICATPGYDPTTGVLYRPEIEFLPPPGRPTRDDARAAWDRTIAMFDQFPFADASDKAVFGSALLTVIARFAIEGSVPGHVFIGNKASTGKGNLVNAAGIVATGRKVSTSPYPADPIEAAKVAMAIARAGRLVVHFDNLEEGSTYGNSNLDSAMTSGVVSGRPVHSPDESEVPFSAALFASGNNIHPAKDAFRRWLPCNLVTTLERPEERDDLVIGDLPSHMAENRAAIVADLLTILAAHALAGRPTGRWGPLGSFEEWDRVVRGAVWFASGIDCLATRRKAADDAPARRNRLALLRGWAELPDGGGAGLTTRTALKLVADNLDKYETLRNALLLFGKDDKPATSGSIGNTIRVMKGNPIEGLRFVEGEEDHGAKRWIVARTTGESGESGESDSLTCRGGLRSDDNVNMCGDNRNPNGEVSDSDSPDSPDSPPAEEDWVRWGPGLEDDTPGIVIDRPHRFGETS